MHSFRQTAHVMVRFNRLRGPLHRDGFDDIRVQRPLHKKIDRTNPLCFLFKNTNKLIPDQLPFFLRIGNTGEHVQKAFRRINTVNVEMEIVLQHRKDFLVFILSQQSGVNENADETIADRS